MIAFTFFISIVAIVALASIVRGYVLSVLWGWFIVPTFSLPPLSIPIAIGVVLILAFTTHQHNIKKESTSVADTAVNAFFSPMMLLLIGWIVTWFI